MFPQRSVHLIGREPSLRSQIDDGDLTTAEIGGGRYFPGERGVGLGHIPVQGGLRAVERGRIGSGPGAGHNAAHGQQAGGDQKKAGRSEHRPLGCHRPPARQCRSHGGKRAIRIDSVHRCPSTARSLGIPPDVASSGEPVTLRGTGKKLSNYQQAFARAECRRTFGRREFRTCMVES